jgi:hypothetical protein
MTTYLKGVFTPVAKITEDKKEETKSSEGSKEAKNQKGGASMGSILGWIVQLSIIALAVYLSWNCTASEKNIVIRVLYALVAGIFAFFYLIYYLIYRVIMGAKC